MESYNVIYYCQYIEKEQFNPNEKSWLVKSINLAYTGIKILNVFIKQMIQTQRHISSKFL